MNWKIIIFCLLILGSFSIHAQDDALEKRPIELSFEYQMYPAGMMPGLKIEVGLGKYYKSSIEGRIAYNRARRHSWGEHGDERGGGWGGSVGYKYYILKPMKGLYVGGRSDVWRLNIDYRDIGEDMTYGTSDDSDFGQSKIWIFQPTVSVGYKFLFKVGAKDTVIFLTPQVAAGWEYNVKTEGEAVGQGAIGLWGLDIGVRF